MTSHPCANGLSQSCYAAYPDWIKQALAYKFLYVILPKQILAILKNTLPVTFIGTGSSLPTGIELPPGSIIPPDLKVPPNWIPWFNMIFTTDEDPRKLFPIGWKFGDSLPRGIDLPKNYDIPPDWDPLDPPHPVYLPGYNPFPRDNEWSAGAPLYVGAFDGGPPHRPSPTPPPVWTKILNDAYWETVICSAHLVPYYAWDGVDWEQVHG